MGSKFSGNFFGCAGYQIQDNFGFETVEDGISKIKTEKPEIVVLCSSDDEYINIAPQIIKEVGKETIIIVAGNPKESIEVLTKAGVKYFIHARSNILETLQSVNTEIS